MREDMKTLEQAMDEITREDYFRKMFEKDRMFIFVDENDIFRGMATYVFTNNPDMFVVLYVPANLYNVPLSLNSSLDVKFMHAAKLLAPPGLSDSVLPYLA